MSITAKLESHPFAAVFPLMQGEEYERLKSDIEDNGLRHPIVLCDGKGEWLILDGRNRYRACIELGIKPKTTTYDGKQDDLLRYVVSANISRRHLNESQRSIVAKKLAAMGGANLRQAAALLNVSERSVDHASTVVSKGTPELVEAVERGDITVSRAAEIAQHKKAQQNDLATEARDQPRKATTVQRDALMTREVRLVESEVSGLRALYRMGAESDDAMSGLGARVLARMFPGVAR